MTYCDSARRPIFGLVALLVLAHLQACGGGGGGPVAHFAPADGAKQVDIRPVLQVKFTGALDPSSVTVDHVVLGSTGFTVPVTLSYDSSTFTIAVTPLEALRHDTSYDLTIDGLRGSSGDAIPPGASHFSTWINAQVEEFDAQQVNNFPTDFVTTLDSDGHPAQTIASDPVGRVDVCTTYVYAGGIAQAFTQSDPGPDGRCFTADDLPQYTARDLYDANGARVAIDHFDGDGTGPAYERVSFEFDALGDSTRELHYDAGPDGLVGTDDDVLTYGTASTYDAQGILLHTVYNESGSPGQDGVLFTDDDIYLALVFKPGVGDAPDASVLYSGPGTDDLWLTSDDVAEVYTMEWHDDRGNVVRTLYGGYIFGTAFNSSCRLSTYDDHDNLVTATDIGIGTDGNCDASIVDVIRTYDTTH